MRGLHGWDSVSTMIDPDEVIRNSRQAAFRQLITMYLAWWPSHQGHPAWTSLTQRGQSIAALLRAPAEPRLDDIARVECDANRHGQLRIRWNGLQADVGVMVFADGVTIVRGGKPVEFPDAPRSTDGSVEYELTLAENQHQSLSMTVGIVDDTEFPFDLRTVEVAPPVDPSRWRVEFLAAESRKPIHQSPTLTSDRPGTRISLPPAASVDLLAELVIPATDSARTIEFECVALPVAASERVLIPKTSVSIPVIVDGQKRIPLPPVSPAGGAATPPATPSASVDLDATAGLLFRFIADGKSDQVLEYFVLPELWSPETFIRRPTPQVVDNMLKVPITPTTRPQDTSQDWLIPKPEEVAVTAELSPILQSVANVEKQLGELNLNGGVALNGTTLAKWVRWNRFGEFWLSVGGWPYAWRWRMMNGEVRSVPETGSESAVRIVAPADDELFERKPDAEIPDRPIHIQILLAAIGLPSQRAAAAMASGVFRSLGEQSGRRKQSSDMDPARLEPADDACRPHGEYLEVHNECRRLFQPTPAVPNVPRTL